MQIIHAKIQKITAFHISYVNMIQNKNVTPLLHLGPLKHISEGSRHFC